MAIAELQDDLEEEPTPESALPPSAEEVTVPEPAPVEATASQVDYLPAEPSPSLPPRSTIVLTQPVRALGLGSVLAVAFMSLVCGLGGGAIFVKYLQKTDNAAQGSAGAIAADGAKDVYDALVKEFHEYKAQNDQKVGGLEGRIDIIPKPEPTPDFSAYRRDLDQALKRTGELEGGISRIQRLDQSAEQLENSVKTLRSELAVLDKRVQSVETAGTPALSLPEATPLGPTVDKPSSRPVKPRAVAPAPVEAPRAAPAVERVKPAELAQGIELYRQGKYPQALSVFNKLQLSQPADARVWYFSALTQGRYANEWSAGPKRLVERGLELEANGSPSSDQIDLALRLLGNDPGRTWLTEWRKRSKTP